MIELPEYRPGQQPRAEDINRFFREIERTGKRIGPRLIDDGTGAHFPRRESDNFLGLITDHISGTAKYAVREQISTVAVNGYTENTGGGIISKVNDLPAWEVNKNTQVPLGTLVRVYFGAGRLLWFSYCCTPLLVTSGSSGSVPIFCGCCNPPKETYYITVHSSDCPCIDGAIIPVSLAEILTDQPNTPCRYFWYIWRGSVGGCPVDTLYAQLRCVGNTAWELKIWGKDTPPDWLANTSYTKIADSGQCDPFLWHFPGGIFAQGAMCYIPPSTVGGTIDYCELTE